MSAGEGDIGLLRRLARGTWTLAVAGEEARLAPVDGGAAVRVPAGRLRYLAAQGAIAIEGERVRLAPAGRERVRRALLARAEAADGEPAAGRGGVADGERPGPPGAARSDGPLGWLARRRDREGRPLLDPVEIAAGERLATDFERACLRPRVTQSWNPAAAACRGSRPAGGPEPGDVALDARDRLRRALDAVGSDLAGVLWAVCCEAVGLEELERRHGWPRRCGKVVLSIALRRLADHYGLSAAARGPEPPAAGAIRHWGAADYRPRIDGAAGQRASPEAGA